MLMGTRSMNEAALSFPPLPRHARPGDFEVVGRKWTVDLAPCDPKVSLRFGSIEGELHYEDALHLAAALTASVEASEAYWEGR